MAEYIKTLKEDNGDITYPQTVGGAVLLTGGSDLETELAGKATTADVNGKISIGDVQYTDLTTDSVRTTAIQDSSVTTAKVDDGAITTGKIADDAVTKDKMNYSGYGKFARDLSGGSQSYSANTAATALFPNKITDEVGCSYSSGVFTISQPGWWIVTAGARCGSATSAFVGTCRLQVNGVSQVVENGTGYANSSVYTTYNTSVVWQGHLASGDKVLLQVQPGNAQTNNSAKQQHIEGICLMPD